jgi:hypothetical protein
MVYRGKLGHKKVKERRGKMGKERNEEKTTAGQCEHERAMARGEDTQEEG